LVTSLSAAAVLLNRLATALVAAVTALAWLVVGPDSSDSFCSVISCRDIAITFQLRSNQTTVLLSSTGVSPRRCSNCTRRPCLPTPNRTSLRFGNRSTSRLVGTSKRSRFFNRNAASTSLTAGAPVCSYHVVASPIFGARLSGCFGTVFGAG